MTDNDIAMGYASPTEESIVEENIPLSSKEVEFINRINASLDIWKECVYAAFERLDARKEAKSIYLLEDLDKEFGPLYKRARAMIDYAETYTRGQGVRHELADEAISRAKAIKSKLQNARKQYKIAAEIIGSEIEKCKQDEAFRQKVYIIVQDELTQLRNRDVPSVTVDNYVAAIIEDFAYPSEELIRTWVKKNRRGIQLRSIYEVFETK